MTLVARLVPIKRVDRFLRVATRLADLEDVRFLVVGDGELRSELQASDLARSLAPRLVWTGIRRDMPSIMSASDVVALSSDNEGTPVSLIEAQAGGVPVVGTKVGGVAGAVCGRSLRDPRFAGETRRPSRVRSGDCCSTATSQLDSERPDVST